MKFLVQLFLLSVLCIGLSSCEDDQDVVDSTIIGRSWTGDVGMLDDFGMSMISTFVNHHYSVTLSINKLRH